MLKLDECLHWMNYLVTHQRGKHSESYAKTASTQNAVRTKNRKKGDPDVKFVALLETVEKSSFFFFFLRTMRCWAHPMPKVCLYDLMVCKSVSLLIPLMRCVSVVEMGHSMHAVGALPYRWIKYCDLRPSLTNILPLLSVV